MNHLDNLPAVAVITSGTRRLIVSAYFASRTQQPVQSAEFESMEAFKADNATEFNLVIVDSCHGREYLQWTHSMVNPPLAIIVSEDPELDWVSLERPKASIRLVRPEGLLRAVSCELDRAKAQRDKSSRRQRLVIPPGAQRGLAPLGGTTAPRVRTARLDLRMGTYDLTRSSLRIVASRIANERRTGVLRIRNGEERAELHFFLGQTQRAMYGGIEGLAALVRFAHWTRGYATWSDEPVSVAASLDPDTARILIGIAPSMGTV